MTKFNYELQYPGIPWDYTYTVGGEGNMGGKDGR